MKCRNTISRLGLGLKEVWRRMLGRVGTLTGSESMENPPFQSISPINFSEFSSWFVN